MGRMVCSPISGFDQPLANGRESAINVLRVAAHASYEKDLSEVLLAGILLGKVLPEVVMR